MPCIAVFLSCVSRVLRGELQPRKFTVDVLASADPSLSSVFSVYWGRIYAGCGLTCCWCLIGRRNRTELVAFYLQVEKEDAIKTHYILALLVVLVSVAFTLVAFLNAVRIAERGGYLQELRWWCWRMGGVRRFNWYITPFNFGQNDAANLHNMLNFGWTNSANDPQRRQEVSLEAAPPLLPFLSHPISPYVPLFYSTPPAGHRRAARLQLLRLQQRRRQTSLALPCHPPHWQLEG
jgi:hypothetical protein